MVVAMIVACEVGFWVLVALGLCSRYVLGLDRLGKAFLYSTPLLELTLLVVSVIDLRGGATAGSRHGIAALYIGFTVMFGHRAVRWVDERIRYHFLGGPTPRRPPARGSDRIRHEVTEFGRTLVALAIASVILGALVLATGDADRTEALTGFFATFGAITLVALIITVIGVFEAFGKKTEPKAPPRRLRDHTRTARARPRPTSPNP